MGDCSRPRRCDSSCNEHGVCRYGQCFCDPGYMGPSCEIMDSNICPSDCSGPNRGLCTSHGCLCAPGAEGEACELDVEPVPCLHNCSGWGECIRGHCRCFAGRRGADCAQIEDVACSNNCNGRGLCHHGHCFCHNGYTGSDCSDLVSSLITVDARSAVAAEKAHKDSALGLVMSAANRAGEHVNHHLHSSTSLILAGVAAAAFVGGTLTSVWWL